MAKGNESSYLLVAAIDFGTTFSGFAFSTRHDFEKDPTNTNIKRWIDPTSSMVYNKTSTCILFTKEKKFNSFGFEAEAKYLDLVLDNEHKNWYFFRRFKMTLYEFESIDQQIITEDEGGKSMPALVVFTESIKYLKQSLLDEVKNQQTDIQMNDIKWIVTVPAIWSDPAKMFMRRVSVEVQFPCIHVMQTTFFPYQQNMRHYIMTIPHSHLSMP